MKHLWQKANNKIFTINYLERCADVNKRLKKILNNLRSSISLSNILIRQDILVKSIFYQGLILKEFYYGTALSCADLSNKIGKSIPFIMKILDKLIEEGYSVESGYAPSSGGRRPVVYSIKPDTIYLVSVAMDQLVTRISVMDIQNRHVAGIQKFELTLKDNPNALFQLAENIEQAVKKSGVKKKKIIGIGIGMPGFIDTKKGINYSFLETKDKSVAEFLSEKLSMPVYIDNDSSLIALAELRFGGARHLNNAMIINISWGVGLGMILNGELFRGHNGFAGEFSHIPMFNNNKQCSCGKFGCLETETSLLVVIEKAKEGLQAGRASSLTNNFPLGDFEQDYKAIADAALKGDQFAVELFSEVGYNIGRGVAILIHLMNPESVILSGRGALAGRVLLAPIQQALNEHSIPRLAENTVVEVSALGNDAELTGAAALVMESQVKENKKIIKEEKAKKRLLKEHNGILL